MELHEYPVRVCVAGSRSYHNSYSFEAILNNYVKWLVGSGFENKIAFISGGAKRGADTLIIEWSRKHGYPCFVFEADWDTHGPSAGFRRNAVMRDNLTHLLAFWDGESHGTEEMVEKTMDNKEAIVSMIMVAPDSGWKEYQKRAAMKSKKKGFGYARK